MKVAFKWRANENTFLYITGLLSGSTIVDGKPIIFDSIEKECTYYDGTGLVTLTGISKTMIPEIEIANKVKAMSETEYSTAYDAMKRLASLYPATQAFKFMDYTYYYNLENDECVEEKLIPICDTDLIDVAINAKRSMTLSVASSTTLSMVDGEVKFDISGRETMDISDSGLTVDYDGSNDKVSFNLSGNESEFNVSSEDINLVGRGKAILSGDTVNINGNSVVNINTQSGPININGKDTVNINSDTNVAIEGFNFNDNEMTYGREDENGVYANINNTYMLNQLRGASLVSGVNYDCLTYYKLHTDRDKILYNKVGYNSIDEDGVFMESEIKMSPKNLSMGLINKNNPTSNRNYGVDMNFFIEKDSKALTESCSWDNSVIHYNMDYKDNFGLSTNIDMLNSAGTATNQTTTNFIISEIGGDNIPLLAPRKIFMITDTFTYQGGPTNPHRVANITTNVDNINLNASNLININAPSVLINGTSIGSIGSAITSVNTGSNTIDMSLTSIGTQGQRLNAEIKQNSITGAYIANNAIVTRHISDKNVTTDKLADSAVTEDKIANDAVTTDKIVNSAITSTKIANDAVTTDKIENSAVTNDKLAQNAVDTNNIKANAVTKAKIDTAIRNALTPIGCISIWGGKPSDVPDGWIPIPPTSQTGITRTIPLYTTGGTSSKKAVWIVGKNHTSQGSVTIFGKTIGSDSIETWFNSDIGGAMAIGFSQNNYANFSTNPTTYTEHLLELPLVDYPPNYQHIRLSLTTYEHYGCYMLRYK